VSFPALPAAPPPDREPPREIEATTLFGQRREVLLVLNGEKYRLRITANGKLLLTK
jgi:hemin uptake protein HemP